MLARHLRGLKIELHTSWYEILHKLTVATHSTLTFLPVFLPLQYSFMFWELKNPAVIWNRPHFTSGISLLLPIFNHILKCLSSNNRATLPQRFKKKAPQYPGSYIICCQRRDWLSKQVSKPIFRTSFGLSRHKSRTSATLLRENSKSLNVVSIKWTFLLPKTLPMVLENNLLVWM